MSHPSTSMRNTRLVKIVGTVAGVALAYALLGALSLLLPLVHHTVAVIWPASGLALASVLLLGRWALAGVFIGSVLANILGAGWTWVPWAIAIGNTLAAGIGARLMRAVGAPTLDFSSFKQALVLVVPVAFGASFVSSLIGVASLRLGDVVPAGSFGPAWFHWWTAEALSIVLVTPLLLAWRAQTFAVSSWPRLSELVAAFALLLSVLLPTLLGWPPVLAEQPIFGLLAFPVVSWIALRFGLREATLAVGVLAAFALAGVLRVVPLASAHGMDWALAVRLSLNATYLCILSLATLAMCAFTQARRQSDAARARSEARLSMISRHMADVVCLHAPDGRYEYVSPSVTALLGYAPEELIGRSPDDYIHAQDLPRVQAESRQRLRAGDDATRVEFRWRAKSGEHVWLESRAHAVRDQRGTLTYFVTANRDITARKRMERQLQLAKSAVDNAHEMMVVAESEGKILWVNTAFNRLSGLDSEQAIGRDYLEVVSAPRNPTGAIPTMLAQVRAVGVWQGEFWQKRADGAEYPTWLSLTAVRNAQGKVSQLVAVSLDLSLQHHAQELARRLASHDVLTGLLNRKVLVESLRSALARARTQGGEVALVLVTLDRFKHINEALGASVADDVLRECAARLKRNAMPRETLGRLSGVEFAIVMEDCESIEHVMRYGQRVLQILREPIKLASHPELVQTASIGIAFYPADAGDAEQLLACAQAAIGSAKTVGGNTCQIYSAKFAQAARERLMLESGVRRALAEGGQLRLHYQPKMVLDTRCVNGAEALLRWRHPELGDVPPQKFIAVAEQSDLIHTLGDWVLEEACRACSEWVRGGQSGFTVAVNVSARQLVSPSFVPGVQRALTLSGLEPKHLELEVTESAVIHNLEQAAETLRKLKEVGVGIALDDFGTGYSSLSHLRELPFDAVKIDRSFVADLPHSERHAAIARAILGIAHAMGFRVIAEGVEKLEQLEFLQAEGCHEIQGFLLAPGLPREQFDQLLSAPVSLQAERDLAA